MFVKQYEESKTKRDNFLQGNALINYKTHKTIILADLYNERVKRDSAFLYNRLDVIEKMSKAFFPEGVFFTMTSTAHMVESVAYNPLLNKTVASNYNEFFRTVARSNLYRTTLTSNNRLYLRVNEFTKRYVLHTHTVQYLKDTTDAIKFVDLLVGTFLNKRYELNLGRFEVVCSPDTFKHFSKSGDYSLERIGGEMILVPLEDLHNIKTGAFVYLKALRGGEDFINQITRYVVKYINKNILEGDEEDYTDFAKSCKYLHSHLRIRRFNFSRFVFPKSLYYDMETVDGTPIYKMYSLHELSLMKLRGLITFEYSSPKQEEANAVSFDRDFLKAASIAYINTDNEFKIYKDLLESGMFNELPSVEDEYNRINSFKNINEIEEYLENMEEIDLNLYNFLDFVEYSYNVDAFYKSTPITLHIGNISFNKKEKGLWLMAEGADKIKKDEEI